LRVLFDTDVVLDLLLDRQPFSAPAADLFSRVERGELRGYLCATTVTTVHYLAAKVIGTRRARAEVRRLLTLFEVAPVSRPILEAALAGAFADFEDAVIYEAARHVDAQRRVLAALLRVGWSIKRQDGSHRVLSRPGGPDFVFAFHDAEEIGPRMLARIAKRTGLQPQDL
jgi:predicted RNA binding protein YcfA (HicA-like mRNA interferase family)/predicted nucleic acid-binding protein